MGLEKKCAEIVFPLPIHQSFFYSIPAELAREVQVGKRVVVPFGLGKVARRRTGYVIGIVAPPPNLARLKLIEKVIDPVCLLKPEQIRLARWVSEYYVNTFGETLPLFLPINLRPSPQQKSLPGFGEFRPYPSFLPTSEQKLALNIVARSLKKNVFRTILLHGVTDSGKTEVYLESTRLVLSEGKQCIMLVPEISLIPQTVQRFVGRFGEKNVAVWHSRLLKSQRSDTYQRILDNKIGIIIGARSAIFLPFPRLGLIVIDEEHSPSYKQEEKKPHYQAREVASKRAELSKAVVILGSATPSIESFYKAKHHEYQLIELPYRIIQPQFPPVKIIDLRQELAPRAGYRIFSPSLEEAISRRLGRQEQVILFLNRRGFATFILCRKCGEPLRCPKCNVSLNYHFDTKKLQCHYCGYKEEMPEACPKCKARQLRWLGVGTQKVEQELKRIFPDVQLRRVDTDALRKRLAPEKLFGEFEKGKIELLIGTQLLTKGLDYPRVTLVGIINADTALNLPDFRSAETTFNLITQVAGRAGRGTLPGEVIVQTYNPEHYAILAAQQHDYKRFYQQEIKLRKESNYPPFCRLVRILIKGKQESRVIETAKYFGELLLQNVGDDRRVVPISGRTEPSAPTGKDVGDDRRVVPISGRVGKEEILGPVPAPLGKLKRNFRWQIIIKTPSIGKTDNLLNTVRNYKCKGGVKIEVNVDPVWMM